ncbi:uncharacterized protein CTRU02_213769 [Colletotrichum truncatum]|uniref:Uncharacterized protein n=1 Tax=Colletotrichum truncatum TaxID=5467 RepID=A0ACC3YGQ6_COLTU
MSISCSLNIPHIIDSRTHNQVKWRLYRYCYGGSIRGLQDMFSEKVITPTTLIDGATLFEWAASFPQPDMCRFILQQNSKLNADEYLLGSKTHPGRNSLDHRGDPEQVSKAYIDLVGMCLATEVPTVIQYRFLVSSMSHPRDMLMCFERFQYNVFSEEWLDFIAVAWDEAVILFAQRSNQECIWMSSPEENEYWTSLFSYIIGGGVDVSRFIKGVSACRTALWHMVNVATCPHNLESALFCWGSILWLCGVELDQYLSEEWSYSDFMWKDYLEVERTFSWPRDLVQLSISGFVFPSWTRRVTSTSLAYEVREEFKYLGPDTPYSIEPAAQFKQDIAEMSERHMHHIWKTLDHPTMEEVQLDAWPFGFCPPRDLNPDYWKWSQWYTSRGKARRVERSFKIAQGLLHARFERRQNKKLYKSGYFPRAKKLRDLPGAWVDD